MKYNLSITPPKCYWPKREVSQNGQTPIIIGICSYCVLDRPVFEWNQVLHHPELHRGGLSSLPMVPTTRNLTAPPTPLKNPRSRSRQFHRTSNGINPSSGFRDMGSAKCGPSAALFDKFLAHGQAHMGHMHNYRSREVQETLNWVNPSSSFRDMRSAKSGPNLWQIWKVFGLWASPYGANGQMTMTVQNYRPRQFHRTSNGENASSGYRDTGSASLAAARQPTRPNDNTPPARRAEG